MDKQQKTGEHVENTYVNLNNSTNVSFLFGTKGTPRDPWIQKKSKIKTFTVREGFFTFWAILAHSVPYPIDQEFKRRLSQSN